MQYSEVAGGVVPEQLLDLVITYILDQILTDIVPTVFGECSEPFCVGRIENTRPARAKA